MKAYERERSEKKKQKRLLRDREETDGGREKGEVRKKSAKRKRFAKSERQRE